MTDTADSSFREVFKEAVWVGFRQTILDQGAELGVLLRLLLDEAKRASVSPELPPRGAPMPPSRYMQRSASTVLTSTNSSPAQLSPRERSILDLIGQGHSNKQIARKFGITAETVKSHLKRAFVKLDVARRAQAVLRAQRLGLLNGSSPPRSRRPRTPAYRQP